MSILDINRRDYFLFHCVYVLCGRACCSFWSWEHNRPRGWVKNKLETWINSPSFFSFTGESPYNRGGERTWMGGEKWKSWSFLCKFSSSPLNLFGDFLLPYPPQLIVILFCFSPSFCLLISLPHLPLLCFFSSNFRWFLWVLEEGNCSCFFPFHVTMSCF